MKSITRENFGIVDGDEHLWLRARMVERLVAQADHLVLFPRRDVGELIESAMGVDRVFLDRRATVAPEGIDLDAIDAARRRTASAPVVDEIVDRRPLERRGRALVVSLGRLHPAKGMTRLVRDWLANDVLTASTNLVIVGGDLERPNPAERRILDEIQRVIDTHRAGAGVVLLGARQPGRSPRSSWQRRAARDGTSPRTASTRTDQPRRSSAWRCSRRWQLVCPWSLRPRVDLQRTSTPMSPACSSAPTTIWHRLFCAPRPARHRGSRHDRLRHDRRAVHGQCIRRRSDQRVSGHERRCRREFVVSTIVLSPDFLSHCQPLVVIAQEIQRRGERVLIATGPAMRALVEDAGLEWHHLDLAGGSNGGLAVAATHDPAEPSALDAFIDATRRGFVATLAFQASKRSRELLWRPVDVGRAIGRLLDEFEPDQILVDQVSLVSTLGVLATGRPFTTVVPGHPTQLPVAGERYGDASTWPSALQAEAGELDELRTTVSRVNAGVTATFNDALAALSPEAEPVIDAFAVHGERILHHWERDLHDPRRLARLSAEHIDLGPLVRHEPLPDAYRQLVDGSRPLVMIALGTFLVHRHDVILAAMRAVERTGARAVVAIGDHDPASFGPVPDGWILARRIPQVALMPSTHCLISHGGNGSTQEGLATGVHHVMLPMSTDQMAIAADLERVGRAQAADPNDLDVSSLADAIDSALAVERWAPVVSDVERVWDARS